MLSINSEKLVYIGFSLIVFKYTMALSATPIPLVINNCLMILGIASFFPNILKNTYKKREFSIIIMALLYGLYNMRLRGDDLIVLIIFFAMALKNTDYREVIRYYIFVTLFCFAFIISTSLITHNNLILTAAYRGEGVYISRYTLGFAHPNSLQGIYLRLVCALLLSTLLIKHKKIKYLMLEGANLSLFYLSNSRTGFTVITLVLLLAFFKDFFIKIFRKKLFYNLIVILFFSTILFTIYVTYNYSRYPIFMFINELITGRFQHANRFVNLFQVHFFGTDISSLANVFTLDSGVISTLLNYGVIGLVAVSIIYFVGLRNLWKNEEYIAMIVILGFVIYSIMESVFINPFVNVGLLMCLVTISNKQKVKNENEG